LGHGKFECCLLCTTGFSAKCPLINVRCAVLVHRSVRQIGFVASRLRFSSKLVDSAFISISGRTPAQLPPHERVDLAILGVALPDSRARLPGALEHLEPRYILPSHQDNFFRPLAAGFQFGPLTDFSRGAARLRTSESWLLNPPGLFPAMDAVDGGKSQIPRTKSQTKDRILTLTEGKAKSRRSTETGDVEAMKAMRRRIALPKHFVRNARERLAPFRPAAAGLSECARVVASLSLFSILAIEIYLEFGN